jgi:hypothetical protein
MEIIFIGGIYYYACNKAIERAGLSCEDRGGRIFWIEK